MTKIIIVPFALIVVAATAFVVMSSTPLSSKAQARATSPAKAELKAGDWQRTWTIGSPAVAFSAQHVGEDVFEFPESGKEYDDLGNVIKMQGVALGESQPVIEEYVIRGVLDRAELESVETPQDCRIVLRWDKATQVVSWTTLESLVSEPPPGGGCLIKKRKTSHNSLYGTVLSPEDLKYSGIGVLRVSAEGDLVELGCFNLDSPRVQCQDAGDTRIAIGEDQAGNLYFWAFKS